MTVWFHNEVMRSKDADVMRPNDADEMANCEDPDQTASAPVGAV